VDRLLVGKGLAAKLAQGDIKLEEYKDEALYDYRDVMQEVLDLI